jgi:hypothetical protein
VRFPLQVYTSAGFVWITQMKGTLLWPQYEEQFPLPSKRV